MATNVNEKDKALQEVIDWCEQSEAEGLRLASALLMQHDMAAYGVVQGQINAYENTADHCRSMLGHSGSIPSEIPNQSEDAGNGRPACQGRNTRHRRTKGEMHGLMQITTD